MKKGILKNAGTHAEGEAATPTKKHIGWDEPNLETNERERPEGGYMKIDEPKTPYHHAGASEEEDSEGEKQHDAAIEAALEEAKQKISKVAQADPAAAKPEGPQEDFAAKRRQHYQREERDVLKKVKAKKTVAKDK